ncbi:hypothetical protein [Methylocystis sp. S23]|jgi:hypothetical protein
MNRLDEICLISNMSAALDGVSDESLASREMRAWRYRRALGLSARRKLMSLPLGDADRLDRSAHHAQLCRRAVTIEARQCAA